MNDGSAITNIGARLKGWIMASSPESYLISSVLRDRDYQTAVAHGINSTMFRSFPEEWSWIEKYVNRYKRLPSKQAFLRHFPEFRIKSVNDTAHFVDEVRKSYARTLMTTSMRDATDLIAEGRVDKAAELMNRKIIEVSAAMGGVEEIDLASDWKVVFDDVKSRKERYDRDGMAGIPTGFESVDDRTGGIGKGQLWVVGARLGEGKTWTVLEMACAAIMAGYSAHVSALEMSKVEVSMRIHNMLSGQLGKNVFRQLDLSQGKDFDLDAYKTFLRGLKQDIKGRLTISDARGIGETEIAAQLERHKPDIYFLDYLTLAATRGDGGWQDIGNFTKSLHNLGGSYDTAMVTAAQLNRQDGITKGGPAGAEALAQSDAIGQDADAVITLKKRSTTITEYYMAKYRHGPAGFKWYQQLDLDRGIVREVSYNDALKIMDADADAEDAAAVAAPSHFKTMRR